uniref:Uncharacterized protein n=1 Tax=Amphimedon queenslandica TaxID=400682 RepID=A0A1X7SPR7_AMPQE
MNAEQVRKAQEAIQLLASLSPNVNTSATMPTNNSTGAAGPSRPSTTAPTDEANPVLSAASRCLLAIDRQWKGKGKRSAKEEVTRLYSSTKRSKGGGLWTHKFMCLALRNQDKN